MSTFVFNAKTGELYSHNFQPTEEKTAHQRLLSVLEWNVDDCVGGSIKENGSIEFRSKSINERNSSLVDLSQTSHAKTITRLIEDGNVSKLKRQNHVVTYNIDYRIGDMIVKKFHYTLDKSFKNFKSYFKDEWLWKK